jgi:REP element-mobilizing transposase RayT
MSEKYKFHDLEGIYFVSPTIIHWIDLFTRKEFKHIVLASLAHCQKEKGLIIYAWVIMPSHLHLIIGTSKEPLEDIMRDFKKYVSKSIIKELDIINESRKEWLLRAFSKSAQQYKRETKFKIWKDGNQPKQLESNHFQQEKLDYLHQNPVEAEIVDHAEDYLYSSARDYAGKKGLLNIEFLN